jgi:hypothetical protein
MVVSMTGYQRYGHGILTPEDSRSALRLAVALVPAGLVLGLAAGWVIGARRGK